MAQKRKQMDSEGMEDSEEGGGAKRPLLESDFQKTNETLDRLSLLVEKIDKKQDSMEISLKGEIKKLRELLQLCYSNKVRLNYIPTMCKPQINLNPRLPLGIWQIYTPISLRINATSKVKFNNLYLHDGEVC